MDHYRIILGGKERLACEDGGRIMAHIPVRHPCGAIAGAMLGNAPGISLRTGTAVLVQPHDSSTLVAAFPRTVNS